MTSQFLHGGWLHVLGNLLFLWIFGNNVEDRFGRGWFLLFYLGGGVVAGAHPGRDRPDLDRPDDRRIRRDRRDARARTSSSSRGPGSPRSCSSASSTS